jgi:hypothetical protein
MTPKAITLIDIETHAKTYAAARTIVADRVSALELEVQAAQRRKLPGIKSAVAEAADAKARLEAAIEQGRELFKSPRTITVHGIKCGLQKGKGKITWLGKPAAVVALIKKHLADKAKMLIKTEETLKKASLNSLSVEELKKIGCTVGATGDHVYVAAEDTAVDKLVERILKEGQGGELEAAA